MGAVRVAQLHGERLLASTIDLIAKEDPQKIYACIPQDDEDISKGFVDITYKQFANAINHASWWLDSVLGKSDGKFETFAYTGPKDITWPAIIVAAAKVGRKILLPSPFGSTEAHLHLLDVTSCKSFIYSKERKELVQSLLLQRPNILPFLAPNARDWFHDDKVAIYEYNKNWEHAKLDPWIVFHTSGTTGLPKPIFYNNLMMASVDAILKMPEAKENHLTAHHFMDQRLYVPLPPLHYVGTFLLLQLPVFLGTVFILGPSQKPVTTALVDRILRHGTVTNAVLPPFILEDLGKKSEILKQLTNLEHISYVGAPLSKEVGNTLSELFNLRSFIGSTDTGPWFCYNETYDPSLWNYHKFCPSLGITFESRSNDLYEPVFHKTKGLERWQSVFYAFPKLDRFPTQDLMSKHPTKPDFWKYVARIDDLVHFSTGIGLNALQLEATITAHPGIRSALIGGNGRKCPFLLLDLATEDDHSSRGKVGIAEVWPAVIEANKHQSPDYQLSQEFTILVDAARPISKTDKGSMSRSKTIALYQGDIDALYDGNE